MSDNIYFGSGQEIATFEEAFANSQTGDQLIDCNEIDAKILPGNHWNWVSFPRLERIQEKYADIRYVLDKFQDFPFSISVMYLDMLVMEFGDIGGCWYPHSYTISSEQGFKLYLEEKGDHILEIPGERLPIDYKIPYPLSTRTANWLGYWIPYSQNIKDAFGGLFENIFAVEAEDWFYISSDLSPLVRGNQRGFYNDSQNLNTPSSSTIGKNFEYGKGYIIYFEEPIQSFHWNDSGREMQKVEEREPAFFTYRQLANYDVIDFLEIPEDVIEIGVFADSVCYGAKAVNDASEQIIVYRRFAPRDEIPYEFKFITSSQEEKTRKVVNVFDKETGLFENRELLAGKQKYAIVKSGNLAIPEPELAWVSEFLVEDNSLGSDLKFIIHFTLQKPSDIELSIHDVNDLLIRQLVKGSFSAGSHSVTWDGKENEGKKVGSGLYLYKLKSNDQVFSKKILLLK